MAWALSSAQLKALHGIRGINRVTFVPSKTGEFSSGFTFTTAPSRPSPTGGLIFNLAPTIFSIAGSMTANDFAISSGGIAPTIDWWIARISSKEIARAIENEATYPGQLRVVVVRETRASDYAR